MDEQLVRQRLDAERERLETLRRELRDEELADAGETSIELSPIDQHQADVGSEVFEREKALTIRVRVDAELIEVADALTRLDTGTYGRCETCGRSIDDERLEAMPATRFCTDHEVLWEGTRMTFSLPAGKYPDGAPYADDLAGQEAARHLDFVPTDDESEANGLLGPEQQAIHAIDSGTLASEGLQPGGVEEAEMREAGNRFDERVEARREVSGDVEAALADEEALGSTPRRRPWRWAPRAARSRRPR
jgi:RNA polymerase-binding transcription factor DksA